MTGNKLPSVNGINEKISYKLGCAKKIQKMRCGVCTSFTKVSKPKWDEQAKLSKQTDTHERTMIAAKGQCALAH